MGALVVGGEEAATMWKGGDKSAGRLISCVLSVPYVSAFVLVVPSHRQCFHLLEEVQEFDYLGLRLDPKLKIALHRIQETSNEPICTNRPPI